MASSADNLRGLVLSAVELRRLTDWNDVIIEEWLNFFYNIVELANNIDVKDNILNPPNIVTESPYTPTTEDYTLFVNTDDGDISITLPPITEDNEGIEYRIVNVGSSGNKAYLIPALTDKLIGLNESDFLFDTEVVILTASQTEGWY